VYRRFALRRRATTEAPRDVIVHSLSQDQEDAVGENVERSGAARWVGAAVRRLAWLAWLAYAVPRAIVAWAWDNRSRIRLSCRAVRVLAALRVGVLCVYAGAPGVLYFPQRWLMYFPEPVPPTPAAAGLPQAEEITLTTSDGEHIIAWHVAPRGTKPLILFLHGNGGALRYRV